MSVNCHHCHRRAWAQAQDAFTCPTCGRVSYQLRDVEERYCGACHDYTGTRPIYTSGLNPVRYGRRVEDVPLNTEEL